MQRNRKAGAIVLICMAVLWTQAFSCSSGPYHDAVVAEHDFTIALQAFQQAELAEHSNGRIDAAEHQKIEAGIERVATAGQVLNTSLQAGASNVTIQENFNTVANALNTLVLDGVFGVKNSQSQNLLSVAIKVIQGILQNIGVSLKLQTTTPITTVGGPK